MDSRPKRSEIADAGEELTSHSLERVDNAASRERIILILLLVCVALLGITLSISAGRVLDRLRTANIHEQEAGRRLARALQVKSDFIADASHELRTPLTLIRGNAEIGLSNPDTPSRDQALTEILSESRRMSRLVDDLLFLARSDSGVPSVEREYIPVRWLLTRLTQPAEAMVRHHERCLTADLAGEGYIEADPERIQQAVLILVDNAARFSPEGACVDLRAQTSGEMLIIAVADTRAGYSRGGAGPGLRALLSGRPGADAPAGRFRSRPGHREVDHRRAQGHDQRREQGRRRHHDDNHPTPKPGTLGERPAG